jgi:hypothetical protein
MPDLTRKTARLPRIAWIIVGLIAAGLAGTGQASAPSDTAEARRAAAEEFLTAIPVAGEVDDLIRQMSEEVIQHQREAFVAQMRQRVDMTYMKQVMLDGLVTGLSARELRAAAVFYGTPEGKAIREKLPKVIDGIMPLLQKELVRTARQLSF